jgi:YD repeat-containing protein
VLHPDGTSIHFTYTDQGLIKRSYGSQVYPREYDYDNKGQLTSLTTWKDFNGNIDSALSWGYDIYGRLETKTDAKNRSVSYSYLPSGQVETKTNARNIVKTWGYDNSGRLSTITYSDDTPSISFYYNELGRLSSVSDAAGSRDLNFNELGQYTGNTWLNGEFDGITQAYTYDHLGRQQTASFNVNGQERSVTYSYNNFGLLEEVDNGVNKYKYGYLSQSPYTVEKLEVKKGAATLMHSIREFDKLMRTTRFTWNTGAGE